MRINLLFLVSTNFTLIAISFFFIPVYTDASGSTQQEYVRCDPCHVAEADEFSRSAVHRTLECTNCHNISDFGPDLYTHRATTKKCTSCHAGERKSFNRDVHSGIQDAINTSGTSRGTDEACVICHTAIDVEMEWHANTSMVVDASNINGIWAVNYTRHGEVVWNSTKFT